MTVGIKEVLLVDDEENFLEVIADALIIYKDYFNVRTAINGKQAVEILRSSHIDFVVTDLSMPEYVRSPSSPPRKKSRPCLKNLG